MLGRDDVVEDSEDEEMQMETSLISDFPKATVDTEQISAFTSLPNSLSRDTISSETVPHNSRPKTYHDSNSTASEIQTSWSSSIADRAKTRIRSSISAVSSSRPAQTPFYSDIISISSDSDDELSTSLPKKARQKSRTLNEFDPSSSFRDDSYPPESSQAMSMPPIAVLEGTLDSGADIFEPPRSDFFASTEDHHPSEAAEKPSKKSKKSKTREDKGKEGTKKRRAKDGGADEVPTKKSRKKGKAVEVFKSKEFIDDDEDETPTHRQQSPVRSLNPHREPDSPKATKDEEITPSAANPDTTVPGYTEPPTVRTGRGKKRKTSDDDEFDDLEEEVPKKKSRTKKDGSKAKNKTTNKAKPVVLSGEEPSTSDKENREGFPKPGAPTLEEPVLKETEDNFNSKNMSPATGKPTTPQSAAAKPRFSLGRSKSTPMTELIKRVNTLPSSPFPKPLYQNGATAYSPYLKSSRSALSRIAPLHPNRRTPPPPPPPPPPPKKTKKQLEQEEKWEEELIEEAGGITEWSCMTDLERKELRKIKRERETRDWED